jgi:hypothetical protein
MGPLNSEDKLVEAENHPRLARWKILGLAWTAAQDAQAFIILRRKSGLWGESPNQSR